MAKRPTKDTDRTSREAETRDVEAHVERYQRPSTLPTPNPVPGLSFRYIRTATLGQSDIPNVSGKMREGWVPCRAADYPELEVQSDVDSRWSENVEIGGLLLCQMPTSKVHARRDYQAEQTAMQVEAVDNNYLRQSDDRMPVTRTERRTTFSD